jgi:hypothetical protein
MTRDDDAYPPAPTGYGPPSRRTLPYPDVDDGRRSEPAGRALELATSAVETVRAVQEDVSEIKEALGRPPTPGRPGTGLVGTVMQMQQTLDRLVRAEEARAKASTPPPPLVSKRTAIALITALVGSGGVAGIIHAATGNAAPPAAQQQQQQPPRGP